MWKENEEWGEVAAVSVRILLANFCLGNNIFWQAQWSGLWQPSLKSVWSVKGP